MFTGLIDHCGIITLKGKNAITISHHFPDLTLGESIAIDGICLTVTQFDTTHFTCDISPETLAVTTANQFKINQPVNLERALLPTTRMGGHFVTGHIDQIAYVKTIKKINNYLEITLEKIDTKATIKKGSIAINGVSLTINEIENQTVSVMLIPHTLALTNLKTLQEKSAVNIEFDMLAKIIINNIENNQRVHP